MIASVLVFTFAAIAAGECTEWLTKDELVDALPIMAPLKQLLTQTTVECFYHCEREKCTNIAYNKDTNSCRLYNLTSNISAASPIPPLKPDRDLGHQVYYKRWYCPVGWEADFESKRCYLLDQTPVQRRAAWGLCENRYKSELVTFQNAGQRNKLYEILSKKAPTVNKWWTGYNLYNSMLWPRPVDEIAGYVKRRGVCISANVVAGMADLTLTPEQCALKCDKSQRDKCVAFAYYRMTSRCTLLRQSCDNPRGNSLSDDTWTYDKVTAARPVSVSVNNFECGSNDVTGIPSTFGNSLSQCVEICKKISDCVMAIHRASDGLCAPKYRACHQLQSVTGVVSIDMKDVNDAPCLGGVRYRDVCLGHIRGGSHWAYDSINECRLRGGKLGRPSDFTTKYPIYEFSLRRYGKATALDWFDDVVEGNWTTKEDKLTLSNPIYERWNFTSGEPNDGTGGNCASTGIIGPTYYQLSDSPCGSIIRHSSICEYRNHQVICKYCFYMLCIAAAISQSWPTNCRLTPTGTEYAGDKQRTASGAACKVWSSMLDAVTWQRSFPDHLEHNRCRNPFNNGTTGPWCYRSDNNAIESCDIPMCPESDWADGQIYSHPEKPYASIVSNAAADDSYDWAIENVDATAATVCSFDMENYCKYQFRSSCYMFIDVYKHHDDARDACAAMGWHLVTITSEAEQKYLQGIIMSTGKQYLMAPEGYHTGFKGSNNNNASFSWENGEPLKVAFWHPGEPNDAAPRQCARLWIAHDGRWHDLSCTDTSRKGPYICELDLAELIHN